MKVETIINRIRKNKKVTHYYIRKRGSYYRPGSAGYTEFKIRAGVYEKEEAINHLQHCHELTLVPINITEHNELIISEVKELLNNTIKVAP